MTFAYLFLWELKGSYFELQNHDRRSPFWTTLAVKNLNFWLIIIYFELCLNLNIEMLIIFLNAENYFFLFKWYDHKISIRTIFQKTNKIFNQYNFLLFFVKITKWIFYPFSNIFSNTFSFLMRCNSCKQ